MKRDVLLYIRSITIGHIPCVLRIMRCPGTSQVGCLDQVSIFIMRHCAGVSLRRTSPCGPTGTCKNDKVFMAKVNSDLEFCNDNALDWLLKVKAGTDQEIAQ